MAHPLIQIFFSLSYYKHFIFGSESSEDPYNYVDIGVFFNTIVTAILVTIINLCFCYPIAFYMAKVANPNAARLLIVSLIIPFWINELLRSFALRILFAGEGVINNILIGTGIIDTGINFIAMDIALYTGLTYAYILHPFPKRACDYQVSIYLLIGHLLHLFST